MKINGLKMNGKINDKMTQRMKHILFLPFIQYILWYNIISCGSFQEKNKFSVTKFRTNGSESCI